MNGNHFQPSIRKVNKCIKNSIADKCEMKTVPKC